MNKRFGLLSMFTITALLLALVGAVTALAAPSATHLGPTHVDGAFVTDKPLAWYTKDVVMTINIKDADRNVSTARTTKVNVQVGGIAAGGGSQFVDLVLTDEPNTRVTGTPTFTIENPDGTADADFTNSDFSVFIQFAERGTMTVFNFDNGSKAVAFGQKLVISYKEAVLNFLDDELNPFNEGTKANYEKLLVTVTSEESPAGVLVLLKETSADSGEFTGTVNLTTGDVLTDTTPTLKIGRTGEIITVTYTDRTPAGTTAWNATTKAITRSATVDLTKPSITNVSPAVGSDFTFYTILKRPEFKADFSDAHSGVNVNTLDLQIDGAVTNNTCTVPSGTTSVSCRPDADLAGGNHTWQFVGKDIAGNQALSDADPTVVGFQPYLLNLDLAASTPTPTPVPGLTSWGLLAQAVLFGTAFLMLLRPAHRDIRSGRC